MKPSLKVRWPSCDRYTHKDEEFWSHEWRKHGRKHHYRIVPKRFPHESGADLGDNYVGLDCGKSDCRYKVLSDKMRKDDGKYPHSRIPKLFRAFTGDGMDMRYPLRPQKLKPGIKIADEGSIDKAVGGFFKSQKLGYQRSAPFQMRRVCG